MSGCDTTQDTNGRLHDNGVVLDVNRDKKIALISGVTGQDGSYLAEFLLDKGYEVHGIVRRLSAHNTQRLKHLHTCIAQDATGKSQTGPQQQQQQQQQQQITPLNGHKCLTLHYADLIQVDRLVDILMAVQPTEIYNLAGKSDAEASFELTEYTANVNGLGAMRLLDAVRQCDMIERVRFYQASCSAMFGNSQAPTLNDDTYFCPRSPFAVSKVFAHWIAKVYREEFGMYAVSGITFNHESPRKGERYVTRKITRAVARISCGLQEYVELGNINAKRDWGHARDYVQAMWLMLQQDAADDYTVCMGEMHSVREFAELAFKQIGVDLVWEGDGIDEVGRDKKTSIVRVKINPKYLRALDVPALTGDNSKAKKLGWQPKGTFKDLVKEMVEHDLKLIKENLNN